ncbi:flavin reductase family protein, partial [Mycolicibacterium goodii]
GDKLTGIGHEIIPGYGAAIDGSMASFVCTMSESVLQGTHQVVFGRVERVLQNDAIPMAYFRGKFDALHSLAESTLQRLSS